LTLQNGHEAFDIWLAAFFYIFSLLIILDERAFLLVVWHDFFYCHFCALVLNFNVSLVVVHFLAD